jgi:hypothetical protein
MDAHDSDVIRCTAKHILAYASRMHSTTTSIPRSFTFRGAGQPPQVESRALSGLLEGMAPIAHVPPRYERAAVLIGELDPSKRSQAVIPSESESKVSMADLQSRLISPCARFVPEGAQAIPDVPALFWRLLWKIGLRPSTRKGFGAGCDISAVPVTPASCHTPLVFIMISSPEKSEAAGLPRETNFPSRDRGLATAPDTLRVRLYEPYRT